MPTIFQFDDPDPYYEMSIDRLDPKDRRLAQNVGYLRRWSEWKSLGFKRKITSNWTLHFPHALNEGRQAAIKLNKRYLSTTKALIWFVELGVEPSEIAQMPAGFEELASGLECEKLNRLEKALAHYECAKAILPDDYIVNDLILNLRKRLKISKAA